MINHFWCTLKGLLCYHNNRQITHALIMWLKKLRFNSEISEQFRRAVVKTDVSWIFNIVSHTRPWRPPCMKLKKWENFISSLVKRMFSGLLGKRINESLINTPRPNELIRSFEILINLAGKLWCGIRERSGIKIVGECHFLVGLWYSSSIWCGSVFLLAG